VHPLHSENELVRMGSLSLRFRSLLSMPRTGHLHGGEDMSNMQGSKPWKQGTCPCCEKPGALTERHFKGSPKVLICRTCHDEVEKSIPFEEMPVEFYEDILIKFGIGGGNA